MGFPYLLAFFFFTNTTCEFNIPTGCESHMHDKFDQCAEQLKSLSKCTCFQSFDILWKTWGDMDTITLASSLLSKVFTRTYLQSNILIGFQGVETTWNWYTILFNSDEHKFDYNASNDRYTYSTAFHFHSQVHYLHI